VHCERYFPGGSFGSVHITGPVKRTHDLDPKVYLHRRRRSLVMMIEEHIVAVSPKIGLPSQELPDLVQSRSPSTGNLSRSYLTANGSKLPRSNLLH
jgi:hypothetical protein